MTKYKPCDPFYCIDQHFLLCASEVQEFLEKGLEELKKIKECDEQDETQLKQLKNLLANIFKRSKWWGNAVLNEEREKEIKDASSDVRSAVAAGWDFDAGRRDLLLMLAKEEDEKLRNSAEYYLEKLETKE